MPATQKDICSSLRLFVHKGCPFVYRISLQGYPRRIAKRFHNKIACNSFLSPVTLACTPKLYVVRSTKDSSVLYVGYTEQSINNRLSSGLRPSEKHGYHGYKWRHLEEVELMIWVFQPFINDKAKDTLLKRSVECLEAEIALFIRYHTNEWPSCQMEIHFGNENKKDVRKVAKQITKHLF